jgi:hypothetical protein
LKKPGGACLACVVVLALGTAAPRLLALDWTRVREEVSAYEGDEEAAAAFIYRNPGHAPVTITSVDASCGCTDAEVEKRVVAPGESGVLRATMQIGTRTGRQEKWITVTTDEAPAAPVTLTLVVNIKETVVCEPRLLVWKKGSPADERSTDVVAAEGEAIESLTAASVSPAVSVKVEPVEPGRRYRIRIKPASTDKALVGEVACTVRMKGRPSPSLRIYASVN